MLTKRLRKTRQYWLWSLTLLISILVLSAVAVPPIPVQASFSTFTLAQIQVTQKESVEQLQKKQKELKQKQETLQEEQERLQKLEHAAAQRLDGLQDTIQVTSLKIGDTEAKIKQAEQELARLEAELEKAKKAHEAVRTAAVGRLQFMQRQQESEGWAVLIQSKNLNEFLERRYQLKRVYEADRAFLTDLKNRSDELLRQRQGVEAQKNSIALLRQQLLAQRDQYQSQAKQQTQLIDRLKENRNALEAAEAQLVKDSESIAELIRKRLAAARGPVLGTGRMVFPTSGAITSRFGTRVHPILGYKRFHSGLDFGASYGSTIQAADAGRVIFAGWYGGYGNAVIIDHGGGLTSLYAHTSRLTVSEGQAVQRGQAVAAVGSTGLSTGPHLHFEVRRNGVPVDPAAFL